MTDDLTQGSRLGDCELLVRIGRGGMATVWVARQYGATPDEDRLVAVKVLLPDLAQDRSFVDMFRDEVSLIESIEHPNVVEVYGVGTYQDSMYMVMEWVEGEPLHSLIAEAGKRRPIPAEIAVRIIADAAAGLHAAHELRAPDGRPLNVVHRDISPHNILIGTDGRVKLADFGVAKAVGRLSDATRAGQLKGKFGYMAPEQIRGGEIDRRADVFALGIVLYELTTNRRLFRGDSEVETLKNVIGGPIPAPSTTMEDYPPALERIVLRALDRDVRRRYQTAAELEAALRQYLRDERIVVPRSGIARLLKKVMATRIEQRRRVIRKALRSIDSSVGEMHELIPDEPAFTPTGLSGRRSYSGLSAITGISMVTAPEVSITEVGAPSGLRGVLTAVRRRIALLEKKVGGRAPLVAYVVGGASLLIGIGLTLSALSQRPVDVPDDAKRAEERLPAPRQTSSASPESVSPDHGPSSGDAQKPPDQPAGARPLTLDELD